MSLKSFTDAYIKAALWSTTDESDDSGGEPLDKNYGPGDIATDTTAAMKRDCEKFYDEQEESWAELEYRKGTQESMVQLGLSDEQAGRDFWLSRNGHGSGFFDEDDLSENMQKRLQSAAKKFGTFDLYVGDDGQIHGSPLRRNKRGSRRPKKRTSKRRR
jgi:hypothetical protein